MRPIFVFCEGAHDIAFFSRLFKANGAIAYQKKLSDYDPSVIGDLIVNQYKSRSVDSGRFRPKGTNQGTVVSETLPTFKAAWTVPGNDNLYLFFACEGDGHHAEVCRLIDSVSILAEPGAPDISIRGFGLIFTCDADLIGVSGRQTLWVEAFSESLKGFLPDITGLLANDASKIVRNGQCSVTGLVFAATGSENGTLEDVLWEHLESGYQSKLSEAVTFIEKHGTKGTKVFDFPSKKRKAAITIAGQVDSPGYSLSVILRDTKTFDGNTLTQDEVCKNYWTVFTKI